MYLDKEHLIRQPVADTFPSRGRLPKGTYIDKNPRFFGDFFIKNVSLPPFLSKKLSDFLKPPVNLPFRAFSRLRERQAKLGGAKTKP